MALIIKEMRSKCATCGEPSSVREVESRGGLLHFTFYCAEHAGHPQHGRRKNLAPSKADARPALPSINRKEHVFTDSACSGTHAGAVDAYVTLAPSGSDAGTSHGFAEFLRGLKERILALGLSNDVVVQGDASQTAVIRVVNLSRAREIWNALARIVADL